MKLKYMYHTLKPPNPSPSLSVSPTQTRTRFWKTLMPLLCRQTAKTQHFPQKCCSVNEALNSHLYFSSGEGTWLHSSCYNTISSHYTKTKPHYCRYQRCHDALWYYLMLETLNATWADYLLNIFLYILCYEDAYCLRFWILWYEICTFSWFKGCISIKLSFPKIICVFSLFLYLPSSNPHCWELMAC